MGLVKPGTLPPFPRLLVLLLWPLLPFPEATDPPSLLLRIVSSLTLLISSRQHSGQLLSTIFHPRSICFLRKRTVGWRRHLPRSSKSHVFIGSLEYSLDTPEADDLPDLLETEDLAEDLGLSSSSSESDSDDSESRSSISTPFFAARAFCLRSALRVTEPMDMIETSSCSRTLVPGVPLPPRSSSSTSLDEYGLCF
jgi:hypothetical protein